MSAIDKEPFPRGALFAAAALIGFALLAAGAGRLNHAERSAQARFEQTAPVTSLDLRFSDEADGSVTVQESATGDTVTTLAPGTNGFVRSVLRGMVRDRRSRGVDRAPPFRLSQWADGTLILEDTATGKRIDLRAFGPTNKEAFAQILLAKANRG